MAGSNCIDNKGSSGNSIAAGENSGIVGCQCIRVYFGETSAHHFDFILQTLSFRPLTDGENHHIGRNDLFGIGNFVEIRTPIDETAEIHLYGAHSAHLSVLRGNFFEGAGWENFDTLFLGIAHFPIVGRHLRAAFQARHPYPSRAQTDGAHGGIDGYIAAP